MIRTRLTLWNTIVLAFVLSALAVAVFVTTSSRIKGSIDAQLESRAVVLAKGWPAYFESRKNRPPRPPTDFDPLKNSGLDAAQIQRLRFEIETQRPRHLNLQGKGFFRPADEPFDAEAHRKALAGKRGFSTVTVEDNLARIYTIPVRLDGRICGSVQVATGLIESEEALRTLQNTLLVLLPVALVLTSLAGIFLTGRALRPVVQITRATGQIEATNLAGRLEVRGKDEFAVLAQQINSMLSRLEESFKSLEAAYQTQRLFIADASHELKTPLTAIKTRVGIARRSVDSPEKQLEHLNAINRSADSMNAIVQDLLLLAKSESGSMELNRQKTNLEEIAQRAVHELGPVYTNQVKVEIDPTLYANVDPSTFSRALRNLIENAVKHSPANTKVRISGDKSADSISITVSDEGQGIAAEHLPHIFDRFYRVDPSRQRESGGSGLGLAIVKSIVEAHGGDVSLQSLVSEGTQVTIRLPIDV